MIPKHIRDLADALIAELGHRDQAGDEWAVKMAYRIENYMQRQGWLIGEDVG